MNTKHYVLSVFAFLLLAGLSGIVYAEISEVNGTENLSPSGNISAPDMNQSARDLQNGTPANRTNLTDNAGSAGGIKNFMKSFKFKSDV